MGVGYRWFGRGLLRFQDSEKAHLRSLNLLRFTAATSVGRLLLRSMYKPKRSLPVTLFGHEYVHPFGLAAGMDKNAVALRGWATIGLSFIEIGGVTMHGQPGNEKPRMFRAPTSQALVNRMGFNNAGSEAIAEQLSRCFSGKGKPNVPLWVNLGKSKITPLNEAHTDYATSMERLWRYTDVFVINVSSPNTPNLRELQDDEGLIRILDACETVNQQQVSLTGGQRKPLLVKIAPDLTTEQVKHIVETAKSYGADGMVVCNTTVERPSDATAKDERVFGEKGGMSGKPLGLRSTELIRQVRKFAGPSWPIIGVGGVSSAADAWEKIGAGATLLQAYSGFVFEGPSLVKSIVHGLHKIMQDAGHDSIEQAVNHSNSTKEGC
jgi:dihydroorotate dehydrogenase